MTVEINTSHVERGDDQLLTILQRPRISAVLASRLRGWQRIEDAAWEVAFSQNIASGIGVQLDAIGKIVGRGRHGLLDEEYRIALYVQIRINRSNGNPVDFYDVARLSGIGAITLDEYQGWLVIEMADPPISVDAVTVIRENFRQLPALGVGAALAYGFSFAADEAALFGWDGATYDDADGIAHGAGWDLAPDIAGGFVSDIVAL